MLTLMLYSNWEADIVPITTNKVGLTVPHIIVAWHTGKSFGRICQLSHQSQVIAASIFGHIKNLNYYFKFESDLEIAF